MDRPTCCASVQVVRRGHHRQRPCGKRAVIRYTYTLPHPQGGRDYEERDYCAAHKAGDVQRAMLAARVETITL